MDYMQYIAQVDQNAGAAEDLRFLVSGADPHVRRVVGQRIIAGCRDSGKTLFLVDNTPNSAELTQFAGYTVVNALDGEVSLCGDLLNPASVMESSRLRTLLTDLGFSSVRAMQVISYLSFVRETEKRLGNSGRLTVEILEEYGGAGLVEWKLDRLTEEGRMTRAQRDYLMERYCEVSAAGADLELFFVLLAPFLRGASQPEADMAIHLPIGEFKADPSMQEVMCRLMMAFVKQHRGSCAILILDDGKEAARCITELLKSVPQATEVHMLTNDAFVFDEASVNVIMNTFPVRIYSRHGAMRSCEKIEAVCETVDVVRRSYSTTVDRRIRANSAFDILLGTNYTHTEVRNAPKPEPRFRKEKINALSSGTGIIDYGGYRVIHVF